MNLLMKIQMEGSMNKYEEFYKKVVEIINDQHLAAYEVRIELLNLVDKMETLA